MGNPLFSLGRRPIDTAVLSGFERTLRFHGALGFRDESVGGGTDEQTRLDAVPLVFGLIPTDAVVRSRIDELIKPALRRHLSAIGVPPNEALVDLLKAVADQVWETWPVANAYGNTRRLRKASIAALRANHALYRRIRMAQGTRCAICGLLLEAPGEETLDHMVPFRIIGDVADGANWQILCQACNRGKAERFSALQSLEALNWTYRDARGGYARGPSLETRYLVLARARACEHEGCSALPSNAEMYVERLSQTGLWIADNLRVVCSDHASSDAVPHPHLSSDDLALLEAE